MKRFSKFFLIVVLSVGLATTFTILAYLVKNKILYTKVNKYAQSEYELIDLPNELKDQEEIKLHTGGCSYDYKGGAMRCDTRRVKYFVVDNNPYDEFDKINAYLISLGWKHKYYENISIEETDRLSEKGYLPKVLYRKGELNDLELFLEFLGEEDYDDTPYFDLAKKTNSLIDKYYREGKTLYKITISTDFVNR